MGALLAKMGRLGRVKFWGVTQVLGSSLMGVSYLGDGRQHSIVVNVGGSQLGVWGTTLSPQGTFGNAWRYFWFSLLEGVVCSWHLVGRDQDAADILNVL